MATIFSDGFESGDFSAWTGTATTDGGGSNAVNTNQPHCGSYAYAVTANDADWACAYIYKDLGSSYDTLHYRFYVYFDTVPARNIILARIVETGEDYSYFNANAKIYVTLKSGGTGLIVNGEGLETATYTATFNADTWYCIELAVFADASTGWAELWVDGTRQIQLTGLSNSGGSQGLFLGYRQHGGGALGSTVTFYYDCCVVSDSYIGPETSIPVFMHHYTKNVWR